MVYITDEMYMRQVLREAVNGEGKVSPNPLVGAVIVKDGRVIGRGFHRGYGQPHAEREALAACTESPEGGTLYVNLEPCCHYGKTPPCTEAIIESRLARVVCGTLDPNPLVAGKGIEQLQQNGIKTKVGVLEPECLELNEVFFHYITEKTPFVVMKYAMTLDGKIATYSGKSKWITGEGAREHVHRLRNLYRGIMVGISTVLTDDPLLTCRIEGGRDPVRILCDTSLRIPMESKIIQTAGEVETIIATSSKDAEKQKALQERGAEILLIPEYRGHVDLRALMEALGQRKIDSILLEGGGTLHAAALERGLVNKVNAYIAPKIFGGENAPSPVAGKGIEDPALAYRLKDARVTALGEDILLEYRTEKEMEACLRESSKK